MHYFSSAVHFCGYNVSIYIGSYSDIISFHSNDDWSFKKTKSKFKCTCDTGTSQTQTLSKYMLTKHYSQHKYKGLQTPK